LAFTYLAVTDLAITNLTIVEMVQVTGGIKITIVITGTITMVAMGVGEVVVVVIMVDGSGRVALIHEDESIVVISIDRLVEKGVISTCY
jgi:hypothetical protein